MKNRCHVIHVFNMKLELRLYHIGRGDLIYTHSSLWYHFFSICTANYVNVTLFGNMHV